MKNVLITGGSSGLGLRLTLDYLQDKQAVLATYQNHPNPLLYLKKRFPHLSPVHLDLQKPEDLNLEPSKLDTLVLFAGDIHSSLLINETLDHFAQILQTNLTANASLCRQLYPFLKKSLNPHVIFISSRSGIRGNAGQVAYSASKSALVGLAKSLAREWAPDNIKVNVILPGFMRSRQTLSLPRIIHEKYKNENELKRFNTLKEISAFIRFLSSTQNISGQIFSLDSRL